MRPIVDGGLLVCVSVCLCVCVRVFVFKGDGTMMFVSNTFQNVVPPVMVGEPHAHCTVRCVLYALYCILCTVRCVLYAVHCMLCTVCLALHVVPPIMAGDQ